MKVATSAKIKLCGTYEYFCLESRLIPRSKISSQNVPLTQNVQLKGIVQPFELGGETTLIRSAVKY